MQKKMWVSLAAFLIIFGLLFTVGCTKKEIKPDPSLAQAADDEAALKAKQAEEARLGELERQRALEEQRIRNEEEKNKERIRREKVAAMNRFLQEDIHFEFDKSTLLPEAQDILKLKAMWLEDNPEISVVIEGHCDERGTTEYNLALGDRRAQSANNFLVNLGISASRVFAVSYGEERPVDSGHNKEAWAKNRRAHFVIQ